MFFYINACVWRLLSPNNCFSQNSSHTCHALLTYSYLNIRWCCSVTTPWRVDEFWINSHFISYAAPVFLQCDSSATPYQSRWFSNVIFLLKHRHIAIISPVKCRKPTVLVIKTIIGMIGIIKKVVTLHHLLILNNIMI